MQENKKFDFSREEDQKRFEQLPKKEQAKEIASAQQQFNFMLQKVQSGEDYDEAENKYEEKNKLEIEIHKWLWTYEDDIKHIQIRRVYDIIELAERKKIELDLQSVLQRSVVRDLERKYFKCAQNIFEFAKINKVEMNFQKDWPYILKDCLSERHGAWKAKDIINFAKKNNIELDFSTPEIQQIFQNDLGKYLSNGVVAIIDFVKENNIELDFSTPEIQQSYQKFLEFRLTKQSLIEIQGIIDFAKEKKVELDLKQACQRCLKSCLNQYWIKAAPTIIDFAKENNVEVDFSTPEIQQVLQEKYPQGIKVEDLLELLQISEVGIKLAESLDYLTTFSFKNHIQPIINSQGVGAYLYFQSIKNMRYQNLSNDDIEYIILVAKKYGIQARNILENILRRIGPKKIAEEKENIENFIQEIKIIDFDLFQEYQEIKNNPEKKKELKENVNTLQDKVYKGKTNEEDFKNKLYSAVSYHTFTPAIGITKDQYERLNETRPDRRNDVPEVLNDLQYQKFQVPTGKYSIGEDEELNLEKWQAIGNAIKKVNAEMEKETKTEINEIEVGQKLIEMYQKKTTEEKSNQEFLFENMYRYHLQKGGGKLESGFQISIQGLMQYKEFVGDRIKNDLIKDVLTKWKEQNSKEFEKLKADTMNRLKASQAQNFSKVKNMFNAIQKQTDETKKQKAIENLDEFLKHFQMSYDQIKGKNINELARHIEATTVEYEGELTERNYQTEEYYNSESFTRAYDEFTEKKDQDKLVFQKISSDLIAETNKKMRKEVDKFKFETDEGGAENKELEFVISKKKEHGVVGFNTGVCVAPDEQLWNDETFSNCIIFDPEWKQAMGGMHFLIRENNLCLPGINPSLKILSQVENEKLFDQMMEYAKKVKDKLNLEKVLIPTNTFICSNRNQIQEILHKKNYPIIDLQRVLAQEIAFYC